MDDNFFTNILNNPHHVLHKLLPDKTDHTYNLRPCRHFLSLTVKTDCSNFIIDYFLKTFITCSPPVMVELRKLCFKETMMMLNQIPASGAVKAESDRCDFP